MIAGDVRWMEDDGKTYGLRVMWLSKMRVDEIRSMSRRRVWSLWKNFRLERASAFGVSAHVTLTLS